MSKRIGKNERRAFPGSVIHREIDNKIAKQNRPLARAVCVSVCVVMGLTMPISDECEHVIKI